MRTNSYQYKDFLIDDDRPTPYVTSSGLVTGHGHGVAVIGGHDDQRVLSVRHLEGRLDSQVEGHGLVHGCVGLDKV